MREIVLPRCLDVTAVSAVAVELRHALARGELALDAGAVAKVDAAGLQLLCAAVATARTQNVHVRWTGLPAVLTEGAHTLALTAALGLAPDLRGEPDQEIR